MAKLLHGTCNIEPPFSARFTWKLREVFSSKNVVSCSLSVRSGFTNLQNGRGMFIKHLSGAGCEVLTLAILH